ncbi:MAG TPA: site-specific DNA-methyltransferase [Propionibacteriaceae bacterium]
MADHLILLAPSANRVYASAADRLVAAELKIMLGAADHPTIEPVSIAGIGYLAVATETLDERVCGALGRLSGCYATFQREHDRLLPIEVRNPDLFDDDLVTIPKYPGKTNEQFTRLLINVTLASMRRQSSGPISILDPLCGRGTVLSTAMMLGCNAAGVEVEAKAVEAYAAYLRGYLRRKRLKHSLEVNPVRREGKIIGKRLDASVIPNGRERPLALTVFSGDTRQSGALFGKRRFDAVVADAPYGVVHGSRTDVGGVGGQRERSAAGLISEALPVWAMQLKPGGALGLSFNAIGLRRERLLDLVAAAGLEPLDSGPYRDFEHRVDSSIRRDIVVALKP